MSKYDSLVKYVCILDGDSFGSWVIDRENDGTLEHPIQMPYVSYSDMVHHFIGFFKDGSIRKWLERLKELDNGSGTEVR